MLHTYFRLLIAFERMGQGSYRSWKVTEFYNSIFQAWEVVELKCGSWKVRKAMYFLIKKQSSKVLLTNLPRAI